MTKAARQNLSDKLKGKAKTRGKHPGVSKQNDNYWRARHGTKHLGSSKDYDEAVKLKQDYINKLNKEGK